MSVKTRFAPSPTGLMHIGGVRTALYAYLVAKKAKGTFSLRIEDTDQTRLVEGAAEDIIGALKWLGLQFDGEIIYQSKRRDLYKEHTGKLLEKDFAYEKDGAIYFKTKKEGVTSWHDLVGSKDIAFPNNTQEDFVLIKSDGYPTYNFANVIDDHFMEITHVIRGNEFISSTPKHLMLYSAFGWTPPQFAHLPIILGTDKSKLSKRHGAKAASEFRSDGFLAEAILNYMALLGWTPPSGKEILSLDEMIEEFDLVDVHLANPVFDITKLEWMNGEYIRKSQNSKLKTQIWEYLQRRHPEELIEKIVPLVKDRIKKLSDVVPLCDFLWEAPEYDKQEFDKLKVKSKKEILTKILEKMETMGKPWDADSFEKTFRELADGMDIKAGEMFQLIRVAISGQLVTPPLFESIKILGEEETIERVQAAIDFLVA
ncbi:glutamate--tRNA ligase [Candidatus Daviesbacteria bacterium]|nr:glutamate--tRNA ligase [Candidatus Daviesbacteria bacterium]